MHNHKQVMNYTTDLMNRKRKLIESARQQRKHTKRISMRNENPKYIQKYMLHLPKLYYITKIGIGRYKNVFLYKIGTDNVTQ